MYTRVAATLVFAAVIGLNSAAAANTKDMWDLSSYETKDGKLDIAKLRRDWERRRAATTASRKDIPPRGSSYVKTSPIAPASAIHGPSTSFAPPPPTTSLIFFLRKDFADIGLFALPTPNEKADGAQFSWTRDRIANDTTWSADATVALAYTYFVEDIRNPFIGVTVAPYARFNRELHSNNMDNNIDTKTFGLSGEIGFKSPLVPNRSDYFRGRAAVIEDDVKNTTIVHAAAEWLPTYLWNAGTIPGTFINYNFTPELMGQYDSTTESGKTLLFSGQRQSLRVGPQAVLWFKVVAPDNALADYLKRFYGTITYHWWTELYSGREDSWLDTSLNYNLDEQGHIGLALSYRRGRSEDTGALSDLYKVTLTAKTCADLLSKADTC